MLEQFNIFSIARYVQINIYCGAAVCLSCYEIGVVDECVDIFRCFWIQSIQLHENCDIRNFCAIREFEMHTYDSNQLDSKREISFKTYALYHVWIVRCHLHIQNIQVKSIKYKVYDECLLTLTQPQQRQQQQLNNHKPTSKRVTNKHNHIHLSLWLCVSVCLCGNIINRDNAVSDDADSIFSRVFARNKWINKCMTNKR